MSRYSDKKRKEAALTSGITAAQASAVPATMQAQKPAPVMAATFAEAMSTYGLPYVVELEGGITVTLCRTCFQRDGEDQDVVKVIATTGDYISTGFCVFSSEVKHFAAAGVDYQINAEGNQWAEANKLKLINITNELIKLEGGHKAFGQMVVSLRQERTIKEDVKSGDLSCDILDIARGPGLVGLLVGDHLIVLESYLHGNGKRDKLYVKLRAAPFGVPQATFKIGVFAPVADLFSTEERQHFVADFSAFVTGLVPENKKEDFRALVDQVADAEALKVSHDLRAVVRKVENDMEDTEEMLPAQATSLSVTASVTVQ